MLYDYVYLDTSQPWSFGSAFIWWRLIYYSVLGNILSFLIPLSFGDISYFLDILSSSPLFGSSYCFPILTPRIVRGIVVLNALSNFIHPTISF